MQVPDVTTARWFDSRVKGMTTPFVHFLEIFTTPKTNSTINLCRSTPHSIQSRMGWTAIRIRTGRSSDGYSSGSCSRNDCRSSEDGSHHRNGNHHDNNNDRQCNQDPNGMTTRKRSLRSRAMQRPEKTDPSFRNDQQQHMSAWL